MPRPLVDAGFSDIRDFNVKLEAATAAYERKYRRRPSPAMAFALARAPFREPELFDALFEIPRTVSRAVLRYATTQATFLDAEGNQRVFGPTMALGPGDHAHLALGVLGRGPGSDVFRQRAEILGITKTNTLFVEQVLNNFKSIPGGVVLAATSIYGDVRDAVTRGDFDFERTRGIAVDTAKGVWEMIQDPEKHPGDWFVVGLGVVAPGVGVLGRVGAVTRLVARGDFRDVPKAIVFRPPPQPFQLGVQGAQAQVLLAESTLMRALQKTRLRAHQAKLDKRYGPGGTGAPYRSLPVVLRWVTEASERTWIRNMRKQIAEEIRIDSGPERNVARVAKWQTDGLALVEELLQQPAFSWLRKDKDRLVIEKAIQILSTDDFDPVATHRGFHTLMVEKIGRGDRDVAGANLDAHLAQLDAVDAAARWIDEGRHKDKRFRQIYEAVGDMMARAEMLKILELGLDPVRAEHRIAALGAVLRMEVGPRDLRSKLPKTIADLVKRRDRLVERIERLEKRYAEVEHVPEDVEFPQTYDFVGERPVRYHPRERDKELIRATKDRIAYLEGRRARGSDGDVEIAEEVAQLRQELVALTTVDPRTQRELLDTLYAELDQLDDRIVRARPEKPILERVVKDPLDRADYARGFRTFYLPTVRVTDPSAGGVAPRIGTSRYGIRRTADLLAELTHEFTGETLRIGDFRIDVTGFSRESYRRTVRLITAMKIRENAWTMGIDIPKGARVPAGYIPVYDTAGIRKRVPERLKKLLAEIDDGTLAASAAERLSDTDLDRFVAQLSPPFVRGRNGSVKILDDGSGNIPSPDEIRWVDERFLLDYAAKKLPGMDTTTKAFYDGLNVWAGRIMRPINEPFRAINLFLRPAYALNALGAASQALLQQGFLMPANLWRGTKARWVYGPDAADQMDNLMGGGRSLSYLSEGGKFQPTEWMAKAWNPITDQFFRRSALLHELRRQGFKTPEDIRYALGLGKELNAADRAKVVEATRRGKRAMIDFELRPFEKALLRHIFFVYAFQSRSVLWSMHALMDHPTTISLLSQVGQLSEEELDEELGPVPKWFEDTGFVFAGHDDEGRPLVQNWNAISPMGTLSDLYNPLKGLFTNTPYQSVEELFGGFAAFGVRAITGRNEFGGQFEEGALIGAARSVFEGTSAGALLDRLNPAAQEPLTPTDVMDRTSWITRQNSALQQDVFNYEGSFLTDPFLIGGLAERSVNEMAAEARYWRDRPWQERLKHELGLIMDGARAQSRLLGRPVPDAVRVAIRVSYRVSEAKARFADASGHPVTPFEEIRIWVGSMRNEGMVDEEYATRMLNEAKRARDDKNQLAAVLELVKLKAGGDGKLAEWDEDVRIVARTMQPEALHDAVTALRTAKLGTYADPSKIPVEVRREYARRYLKFLDRQDEWGEKTGDSLIWKVLGAQQNEELAKQGDITIKGHTFPSFESLAYATATPQERERIRRSVLTSVFGNSKKWDYLTAFEKKLVGRAVTPQAQAGWTAFQQLSQQYLDEHPKEDFVPKDVRRRIARAVDRDPRYRGFGADYVFSEQLVMRRFMGTSVYRDSKNRSQWDEILKIGQEFERAMNGGYSKTYVRNQWRQYVADAIVPWLAQPAQQGIAGEIDDLGVSFLYEWLDT